VSDHIETAGVLGAGTMGNGIAHVMARAGLRVTLCEVEQRFLDRGIETIRKNLDREVAKEKLTADEAAAALGRIHGTLNRLELAECGFVIEAATAFCPPE
jgi:3-hydroxybutyryl-CoA dehydrogenase